MSSADFWLIIAPRGHFQSRLAAKVFPVDGGILQNPLGDLEV